VSASRREVTAVSPAERRRAGSPVGRSRARAATPDRREQIGVSRRGRRSCRRGSQATRATPSGRHQAGRGGSRGHRARRVVPGRRSSFTSKVTAASTLGSNGGDVGDSWMVFTVRGG
jgi:hypothetical protein